MMVVPGLIFISVEQHDGYFRAGHQKSKAEEKQQFQYDPWQANMPHSARAILSRSSAVRTECQSATPGQEKPRTFLRPYRSHPFPQNSRPVWKTQPTERLPTLLKENERASCKNILTKSYDDTILKAKEGRWLQIGQLLTGIMSKRLTARLGNRGGQSFLLLE